MRLNDEKDAHARQHGHPIDLGFALCNGAHEFDRRWARGVAQARRGMRAAGSRKQPARAVGAISLRFICQALIQGGKPAEGIAMLKAGITFWEATGAKARDPTMKAFLAEAMALTGDIDNALHVIDEGSNRSNAPAGRNASHYAEILRVKGWILSLKGDLEGAERNFLASLEWARRQQAKSWELRTSTSLARLWQSQGKRQDAYRVTCPGLRLVHRRLRHQGSERSQRAPYGFNLTVRPFGLHVPLWRQNPDSRDIHGCPDRVSPTPNRRLAPQSRARRSAHR